MEDSTSDNNVKSPLLDGSTQKKHNNVNDEDALLILSAVKNINNNSSSNSDNQKNISESKKEEEEEEDSSIHFDINVTSPGPYLTCEEFKQIYDKVLYDVNLRGKQLRKYKSGTSEVYGEALPELVNIIIEKLDIKSTDVVYDIGSGIGNVVVQMSAQTGCKCYGVEIRSDLHEIALKIKDRMIKEMNKVNKNGFGEVILINGDALEQPTLFVDTTIVFLNNVCYPENMQHELEHFFLETLKHGTRVVTVKELFPRTRPTSERFIKSFATLFKYPCEQIVTEPGVVSWKASGVTLNIYTVDRDFWNRINNHPFWLSTSSSDNVTNQRKKKKSNHLIKDSPIVLKGYIGESIYTDKIKELKSLHNQNFNRPNNKYSFVILSHNDSLFMNGNKYTSNNYSPLFIHKNDDDINNSFKEIKYNIIDRESREVRREMKQRIKREREEKLKKIKELVKRFIENEEELKKNQKIVDDLRKKLKESEMKLKDISLDRENILFDISILKSEYEDNFDNILSDFNLSNDEKDILMSLKNKKRKQSDYNTSKKTSNKKNKAK